MVFYYKTREPSYFVYVGRDKYENEELIKHGWDTDVWFHVDKVSCNIRAANEAHDLTLLQDKGHRALGLCCLNKYYSLLESNEFY